MSIIEYDVDDSWMYDDSDPLPSHITQRDERITQDELDLYDDFSFDESDDCPFD